MGFSETFIFRELRKSVILEGGNDSNSGSEIVYVP